MEVLVRVMLTIFFTVAMRVEVTSVTVVIGVATTWTVSVGRPTKVRHKSGAPV